MERDGGEERREEREGEGGGEILVLAIQYSLLLLL